MSLPTLIGEEPITKNKHRHPGNPLMWWHHENTRVATFTQSQDEHTALMQTLWWNFLEIFCKKNKGVLCLVFVFLLKVHASSSKNPFFARGPRDFHLWFASGGWKKYHIFIMAIYSGSRKWESHLEQVQSMSVFWRFFVASLICLNAKKWCTTLNSLLKISLDWLRPQSPCGTCFRR